MSGPVVYSLVKLAAVLAAVGVALCAAVVWLMARALLRPPRMTDGKAAWVLKRLSPGDLGLRYEDVTFDVRDERSGGVMKVRGWWIPAAAGAGERGRALDRCVVLLHGYADAKVGAIAWAPVWHDLGYHALAIDLRAHGESGGDESTAGYFERHDVAQVIGQLRAERPTETRQVVLFGVSLGASVAAAVAALGDGAGDVSAVVMESPFADFAAAATAQMEAFGLPGRTFQRAALWLAERLSGARFADVRTVDRVRSIPCPVLIIAPADDFFRSDAETAAMEDALRHRPPGAGPGRLWRVEGANHLMTAHADPAVYRRTLAAFLEEALAATQNPPQIPPPVPSIPPTAPESAARAG
jgi:hypothetical protein